MHWAEIDKPGASLKKLEFFIFPFLFIFTSFSPATATETTARDVQDFYESTTQAAVNRVKKAMPPAPSGWTVSEETRIKPFSGPASSAILPFRSTITYKRINVREEQKRLDETYAESARRNRDAAKPLIDELIRQQSKTSIALRTATRRKNLKEEKRLSDELEENGKRMRAVHDEVDRKIAGDVEPYLIRDADASVSISVNDDRAELRRGEAVSVQGARLTFRSAGERSGTTSWKEEELLVLYGDWKPAGNDRYLSAVTGGEGNVKARTVAVRVTAEKNRAEQLLKQMDLKAILSLMQ